VVDGDTIHADVDMGFDTRRKMTFRLAEINAPEMRVNGEVNKPGADAKSALIDMVGGIGAKVTVTTIKDRKEKYGRYLAFITSASGVRVNEEMVATGHAVPYDGSTPH